MREEGKKVGLLKVRVFRPFPADEIVAALKNCKAIAIMDRAEGYNAVGGPLGADVMAALYRGKCTAEAINIIYGLCGRDVTVNDIEGVFAQLADIAVNGAKGKEYQYLGLRD